MFSSATGESGFPGKIRLLKENRISLKPDPANNTITIGETHSALEHNPHNTDHSEVSPRGWGESDDTVREKHISDLDASHWNDAVYRVNSVSPDHEGKISLEAGSKNLHIIDDADNYKIWFSVDEGEKGGICYHGSMVLSNKIVEKVSEKGTWFSSIATLPREIYSVCFGIGVNEKEKLVELISGDGVQNIFGLNLTSTLAFAETTCLLSIFIEIGEPGNKELLKLIELGKTPSVHIWLVPATKEIKIATSPTVITPTDPTIITPIGPVVITPVEPTIITPILPTIVTPVEPVVVTPVEPIVVTPVKPTVVTPLEPTVILPVEPTVISPVITPVVSPVIFSEKREETLRLFKTDKTSLTSASIAKKLGVSEREAMPLLDALADDGSIRRGEDGKYRRLSG